MRLLALLFLLIVLIGIGVAGSRGQPSKVGWKKQKSSVRASVSTACGKPKKSCIRKGKQLGVTSYCLSKSEDTCTGRFWTNKIYCKKPNSKTCGCCVPQSGPTNVRSAFILTNHVYNDSLTKTDSDYYKAMVEKVKTSVLAKIQKKVENFGPEFFRNGSVLDSTGTSTRIIVDSIVTIKKKKSQQKAEKKVKKVLKKSNVPDLVTSSVSVGVRLCMASYQGYKACEDMRAETGLNIICVQARDRYQCLQWVNSGEADVVRAEPEDMHIASKEFGEKLSAVAKIKDQDKENEPCNDCTVAVVRRSTIKELADLEGSNPCFTDYGQTDGWFVPISKLLEQGSLSCSGDGSVAEKNLNAVSSYFGEACLPGKWAPNNEANDRLKTEYPDLCDLCADPNKCKKTDDIAGYDGVLQCLTNSNGDADVAWTTLDAVQSHTPSLSNSEFGFLCPDGSIMDLESEYPCCWARKPWPGWLIKANDENNDIIVAKLKIAMKDAQNPMKNWAKDLLGIMGKSVITEIDPPISPYKYLEECDYNIPISMPGCDGETLEWCVIDDYELKKCHELKQVLTSRRVRPLFDCIETSEGCIKTIANGDADFASLDGGDVFTAYRKEETTPVINEVYGKHAASYFAVAVVKATTTIRTLVDLKGKDSCHTGIAKTSGWNMPLINLINASLINKDECEFPKQIGNFFDKSCAPGALSSDYDPNGNNPKSLCELCIGNGQPGNDYVCDRDSNELYYGYTGAFRCLVADAGNVAFVKHTTVTESSGDNCDQSWCKNLKPDDYRLLCPEGGIKPVEQYEDCTLGNVPSHMVVTGYGASDALKEDIRILLLRASDILPPGNDIFVLFGDYGAYYDALFKGSATGLINLSQKEFEKLKNGPYWEALTTLADCE